MTKYYEKTLRGPRKVTKSSTNDTSVTATLSVEPPQEGLIDWSKDKHIIYREESAAYL